VLVPPSSLKLPLCREGAKVAAILLRASFRNKVRSGTVGIRAISHPVCYAFRVEQGEHNVPVSSMCPVLHLGKYGFFSQVIIESFVKDPQNSDLSRQRGRLYPCVF